ncbi:MAG: alpha/beta hydrolase family protein [Candidatus Acidiferrales bacterium]
MKRAEQLSRLAIALIICLRAAIATPPFQSSTESHEAQTRGAAVPQGALTVKDVTFRSASLNRDMPYRIYLPHKYAQSAGRFPVLYLLHGIYGNFKDWDTQSHLRQYAQNLELIIVMPDGGNNWYVNSATVPQNRYEDYIVKDLTAEVDGRYRTIASRDARAIAGLSMGGYGSLNLALNHPELFVFAGSFSGALNAPSDLGPRQPEFEASLLEAFGPPGSAARNENDVFLRLKQADVPRLPYIYLACGESDVFIELNRQFAAQLLAEHARYEAHDAPGGHDWKFWDKTMKEMLPVLMRSLERSQR